MREDGVLHLGADGVGFAVHFLDDKVDFSADRLVEREKCAELFKVAAQTDGFLRHGYLVGKYRDLGENPLFVHLYTEIFKRLANALQQAVFVFLNGLRRALFDFGDNGENRLGSAQNIRLHACALRLAHSDKGIERGVGCRKHVGGYLFLVHRRLIDGKDIGKARKCHNRRVVGHAVGIADFLHGVEVARHQAVVDRHLARHVVSGADRDKHINLSSGNTRVDKRLELILQKTVAARDAAGELKIAVVDAFYFHGDGSAVDFGFTSAKTGH